MWTLEQVRAEYDRLDITFGIDTSSVILAFSDRMIRQYGVCVFRGHVPVQIRLASFLKEEPDAFWQTAYHEYAHAAAALLSGTRHGHDALWKEICSKIGCRPMRLMPPCRHTQERMAQLQKRKKQYVVQCCGCGKISRYFRKGTVVQTLLNDPHGCICRVCGAKTFQIWIEEGNQDGR